MTDTHTRPAPERTDGHVLDEVEAFMRRFVAFPSEAAVVATVLWAAHAHLLDCFSSTPRLAFLSPEPGSGKTRALEILTTLVPRPMLTVNATTAAIFRKVSDQERRPTILFDEIDTVFGPKAKENEELRGLLNAGNRRSGVTHRCVGDGSNQESVAFPAYAALALAGLGELPDTILTRSVIIRMRRRAPGEKVEPYRERLHEPIGHELNTRLAAWARSLPEDFQDAFPEMPEGVTDRPADVWEPLLMVADAAGGTWPQRARDACSELVGASQDPGKVSLGVRLLADVRTAFAGADKMGTEALLEALCAMEDAPWAEIGAGGKPIDSRRLSRMLGKYPTAEGAPIKPRTVRLPDGTTPKGYTADDLADAWARYLPPMASQKGADGACGGPVSATRHISATENRPLTSGVAAVADVADSRETGAGAARAPVESGTCPTCHRTFRRYQRGTGYGSQCASCALGVPPTQTASSA
ncbi:DUF3631 domain-containing protein [Nocardiopsis suaedae]|uniref:DUF3631 domain-containing protein n=1 Tax=Nocardiopsis suaedae TaxID=3018444 RepID=A0ABT4TPD4_9ACTN|nr:DUF3631 domain-containing protein [Nocardiopsis suaedae]MDA2806134.1 DUF3631 domain-containing protein [Nocardiopsis suaedae]